RHVAGLPVAGGPRAKLDEHAQDLAGIVLAAAHLHHVGCAGEIARAHFGAGLEAARARDHRLGLEIVAPVRRAHGHALDAAQIAPHGAAGRLKADLDAELFGDTPPLRELPNAAARHVDRDAALEVALAVDLGVLLQRLPGDADLAHPVHRGVRLIDQHARKVTVHSPLCHAVKIGHEVVGAVGRNRHGGEQRVVELGHEAADFLGPGMHEAEAGAGIARVAAVFGLLRLLQHHYALGAGLARRHRRLEGRAAAANHDDVASLDARHALLLG